MKNTSLFLLTIAFLFASCRQHQLSDLQLSGDCDIISLSANGFEALIDTTSATVTIELPIDYSRDSLCLTTIVLSDGATASFAVGQVLDLRSPKQMLVRNGDAFRYWHIYAENESPKALFLGTAATMSELQMEELTACQWMLANVDGARYASLDDIRCGRYNLKHCQFIWWHFHTDVSIGNKSMFETMAVGIKEAVPVLQRYFSNGGNLLLTRYATYLPGYLGINGSAATGLFPNNCFADHPESSPETVMGPWAFFATGHTAHPLFANLLGDGDNAKIYTCDAGYRMTKTTAQWHIGSDWGGLTSNEQFRTKVGALDLAYDGSAVVVWEFPRSMANGAIICIGSGCYDWFSTTNYLVGYHQNIPTITLNAIRYLTSE